MMKKIMIHADALMDFRLAAVNAVSPESIPRLMETYDDRLFDDFEYEGCSQETVDALLTNLDALKQTALSTAVGVMIRNRLDTIKAGAPHEKWEVVINTHPLNMTEEERSTLSDIMGELFGVPTSCATIPYHLYPEVISKYSLIVGYMLDWTTEMVRWLEENPQPELVVYAARCLKAGAKEAYRKADSGVFDTIELAYRPVFLLQFLPIKIYNALTDDKVKEIIRLSTLIYEDTIDPRPSGVGQ